MKLRSKLLLSATCLLTISVAATATSAYAWFTANRQAFVSVTSMKVNSKTDRVFIEPATGGNIAVTADASRTSVSGTALTIGTDISGDGKTFYKPSFKDSSATTVNSVTKVSNPPTGNNVYYHEFKVKITHQNTSINTGLFLSRSSTITGTTPDLSGAYRVAILDGESLIAYFAPQDATSDLEYVHTATLNNNKLQTQPVSATNVGLTGIYASNVLDSTFTGTDVDDSTGAAATSAAAGYLGLIGDGGRTLTVRIWCEGTDSDCENTKLNSNSPVAVNLVFNGVTMKTSA